jgi:hypothetical protein
VGRLCAREKYLKIEKDAHELLCNILTFLPGKLKSAELIKEENRGEKKFRAPDKITFPIFFMGKDSNSTISSNLSLRIF